MKDHVTLKTGVMMLKIHICHHRNKLHFKMYSNRKQILSYISQYYFFSVYLIKCILRLFSKTFRNLTDPKLFNSIVYMYLKLVRLKLVNIVL